MNNKWINAKDQLPTFDVMVLVKEHGEEATQIGFVFKSKSGWIQWEAQNLIPLQDFKGYESCNEYSFTMGTITHWMPLPEPPKEEETQ